MAPDGSSPDSSDRCQCGETLQSGHRYCPACGTPTAATGPAPYLDPADGPLLLLGRSGGPSTAETRVRTGGPGFIARLVGIGLAIGAVILIWGLFRQPSAEVAPEPSNEEAVADTEPDRDDGPDDGPEQDDADDATEASSTTTTQPRGQGSTASDAAGSAGGSTEEPTPPLLGELTGLRLALGRSGGTALQIIDLDSGDVQELDDAPGNPIGYLQSTLVLYDENEGRTALLDLDDIEAGAIGIGGRQNGYVEVVEITEDRIWIVGYDDGDGEGPTLEALNLDGVVVEELDLPTFSRFGFGPGSLSRASELVYDPAGGLYRRTGDGYELVADGQVLAAGERLAVIRQCDDQLECQLRWYDLRSSGVIGFPAPPPADGQGFYQLLGGDRWLAYFDWQNDQARLIEVATARVTRDLDMESFFRLGPGATTMTADGRWLVDVVERMLVIVDLDTGTEWPLGVRGPGVQGVFIEGP